MKVATQFLIEPMRLEHIPAVQAIERLSFPQPWPANAYRRELQENRMARYIIVRDLQTASEPAPVHPEPSDAQRGEGGLLDKLARLLRHSDDAPVRPEEWPPELQSIVGYAGMWIMADEAHITTIATHPRARGQGVGDLLVLALAHEAMGLNARWLTLEVRASNAVAQSLYRKYTFKEMGVRRRYYSDNGEDAFVMWTDALDSDTFLEALQDNEIKLGQRLGAEIRNGEYVRTVGNG